MTNETANLAARMGERDAQAGLPEYPLIPGSFRQAYLTAYRAAIKRRPPVSPYPSFRQLVRPSFGGHVAPRGDGRIVRK